LSNNERHQLMDATCRVALAAYLHDLGKLAERAGAFDKDSRLAANVTLYCPFHTAGGYHSHRHAVATALAFDVIEEHIPDLLMGDVYPFASRASSNQPRMQEPTDSLINAAAAHHKPETFLQWIIATADRVASGFEREEFDDYNKAKDTTRNGLDHFTSRQLTLFEQIRTKEGEGVDEVGLKWRYPLLPLSPSSAFPVLASEVEIRDRQRAKREYKALWDGFVAAIGRIPHAHRFNWPLWLDHFDSLWLIFTHAIPAATAFNVRPEVSLFDHSRTTAALAAALWRWHKENDRTSAADVVRIRSRQDFSEQKLLLVQGDFFGIQDFIFATGGETQKNAAKLLRGRSFQVSLFTELAAARILDDLGLPPTSQVMNAAGKFLIVAPNTQMCRTALERLKAEFDHWFLEKTFGLAGMGLAWEAASCSEFLRGRNECGEQTPFAKLMKRLFESLERTKYQRFDLARIETNVLSGGFPQGVCAYNGRFPADRQAEEGRAASCAVSRDQITIGEALVRFKRAAVLRANAAERIRDTESRCLETPIFGYRVAFANPKEDGAEHEWLSRSAANGDLRRCWDFSLPAVDDGSAEADGFWAGYSRRFISGYIPRWQEEDHARHRAGIYKGLAEADLPAISAPKTLDLLACEDREQQAEGCWQGVVSLGVLKGDIDNLGELFRVGLKQPSFAKWAGLSRQVNAFFALYLPTLLEAEFPNVYTVFAGGDDFLLIGPWRTTQRVAARMRIEFARFVAANPGIHFSVGIATAKPGAPIAALAEFADEALKAAKDRPGKDAATCFGETVAWADWQLLEEGAERLHRLREETGLSTAFVYGLLQFIGLRDQQCQGRVEASIWRSRLAYQVRRFIVDKLKLPREEDRRRQQAQIMQDIGVRGIEKHGGAYRIVVLNHLYQRRDA
jgi:CRISPR-associated protein Csm1